MDDTGLNQHDALGCAVLFDGYARSYANLARQLAASDSAPVEAGGGRSVPGPPAAVEPTTDRCSRCTPTTSTTTTLDDDLDFGLNRILDGIQVLIDRR